MDEFLSFKKMITPTLVMIFWVLGQAGIALASFVMAFAAFKGHDVSLVKLGTAAAVLIGGSLGWRILCELMIVIFKIHEALQYLGGTMERRAGGPGLTAAGSRAATSTSQFCIKCKAEIPAGAWACPECGEEVKKEGNNIEITTSSGLTVQKVKKGTKKTF